MAPVAAKPRLFFVGRSGGKMTVVARGTPKSAAGSKSSAAHRDLVTGRQASAAMVALGRPRARLTVFILPAEAVKSSWAPRDAGTRRSAR
jgi:hypothetical protein